jgi:hypothetical protein
MTATTARTEAGLDGLGFAGSLSVTTVMMMPTERQITALLR